MTNYGYMAKIGADTSGLQQGLKTADSALKSTDKELNAINRSIRAAEQAGVSSAGAMAQKQAVLTQAISETEKKLQQLKSVEEQMKTARDSGNISAEQYREYEREIANTEARLRSYQNELANVNSALRNGGEAVKSYSEAMSDLKTAAGKVADDLKEIGTAAAAAAAAIGSAAAGLAAYAVNVGSSFEESMSKVKAYSGAVGEDFDALKAKAEEMGAKTSKSASESADALGYMALAGWNTEQMLTGLEPILRASEAGGADLARTSDLVTDSMSAMGIAVGDLNHYLDVCTAAQSNSNTSLTQLLEAYKIVGGTMRNLNVDVEESAALLGVLANRGKKGAEAGNSLNSILVNLVGANKNAANAMDALGVSAWDAEGNFIGVTNTLKLLSTALANCTEEQKTLFEAKIGGKTQLDTLQALISGVTEEYDDLYDTLNKCDGALMNTAQTMQDNLKGALTVMNSELEAIGISVYGYLEEPFKAAVKSVNDELVNLNNSISEGELSGALKNLSAALGELIADFAEFAVNDGIPALIDALTWIAENIDGIIAGVKTLGSAWLAWKIGSVVQHLGDFISSLAALKTATAAAATEQAALNAVVSVNPYVAVAAAIGIAVTAITNYAIAAGRAEIAERALRTEVEQEAESLRKQAQAYEEEQAAVEENIKASDEKYRLAEKMWQKIQDLTDETGKLTAEDKDLKTAEKELNIAVANLNDIMGTHIEIINGQIQGYSDLCDSMDGYIAKARQTAELEYLKPAYGEALAKRDEQSRKTAAAERDMYDKQQAADSFRNWYDTADPSVILAWEKANGTTAKEHLDFLQREANAASDLYIQEKKTLDRYDETIENYEGKFLDYNGKKVDDKGEGYKTNDQLARERGERQAEEAQKGSDRYNEIIDEQNQKATEATEEYLKEQTAILDKKLDLDKITEEQYYTDLENMLKEHCDENSETYVKYYKKLSQYKAKNAKDDKKSGTKKTGSENELSENDKALKEGHAELDRKRKLGMDEAEYYDELEKLLKDHVDVNSDIYAGYYKELSDYRKKQAEDEEMTLEKAVKAAEHKRKTHQYNSDDEYYNDLRKIRDDYKDENSEEWWKLDEEIKAYDEQKKQAENFNAERAEINRKYRDGEISSQKEYYEALKELADKYGKDVEGVSELETEISAYDDTVKKAEKEFDDLKKQYDDGIIDYKTFCMEYAELSRQWQDNGIDLSEYTGDDFNKVWDSELKKREKTAEKEFDELKKQYDKGKIDYDTFCAEYLKLQEKWGEQQVDLAELTADKIADVEEKETDRREKEFEEWQRSSEKVIEDIISKYEELAEKRQSIADNIASSPLTEDVTLADGSNKKVFQNLSKRSDEIKKYMENYKKLLETGVPDDLLAEIRSMSFNDRKEVVAELVKMSAVNRKRYYNDYTEWRSVSMQAAEMETANDEAELDEEAKKSAKSIFDDMPENAREKGLETANAYIDGLNEGLSDMGANSISLAGVLFGNAAPSSSAAKNDPGSAQKAAYSEGKKTAESFLNGLISKVGEMRETVSSMYNTVFPASSGVQAAGALTTGNDMLDALSKKPFIVNIAGTKVIEATLEKFIRGQRISDSY